MVIYQVVLFNFCSGWDHSLKGVHSWFPCWLGLLSVLQGMRVFFTRQGPRAVTGREKLTCCNSLCTCSCSACLGSENHLSMVWWLCPFSQSGLGEDTQAVAGEHFLYSQHPPVTFHHQTVLIKPLSYELTSFFLMVKEQFSDGTENKVSWLGLEKCLIHW